MDSFDEIRRFRNIQVTRYLKSRPQQRFSGRCEYDVVMAIIADAWVELRISEKIDTLSRQGRDALYCTTIIVFPGFVADNPPQCIPVDFVSGQVLGSERPSTGA